MQKIADSWVTDSLVARHNEWHASPAVRLLRRQDELRGFLCAAMAIIEHDWLAFDLRLVLLAHLDGQRIKGLVSFACVFLQIWRLHLLVTLVGFLVAPARILVLFDHSLLVVKERLLDLLYLLQSRVLCQGLFDLVYFLWVQLNTFQVLVVL